MITVNRIDDLIFGSANGTKYSVSYTPELFKSLTDMAEQVEDCESVEEYEGLVKVFLDSCKESFSELVATKCKHITYNKVQDKYYLILKNGVVSSWFIPKVLVDRILQSIELNIDVEPLVKFWARAIRPVPGKHITQKKLERLCNYVNYMSVDADIKQELMEQHGLTSEAASARAMFYQTPITMEGLICTYKVSKEVLVAYDPKTGERKPRYEVTYDENTGERLEAIPVFVEDRLFEPAVQGNSGDAFWCETAADKKKGHFIKLGAVHYLESPEQVDQRDEVSCVKGLHVGNTDYIRGYHKPGTELHEVFVDPADVFAITDDGSGALRVLRYYVYKSHAGKNRGIYHSSKYAAFCDLTWKLLLAEILEAQKTMLEKVATNTAKSITELEGLV